MYTKHFLGLSLLLLVFFKNVATAPAGFDLFSLGFEPEKDESFNRRAKSEKVPISKFKDRNGLRTKETA